MPDVPLLPRQHTIRGDAVLGNIYRRPNRMAKGQVIEGHAHKFDHVSYVTHGAVSVVCISPDGTRSVSRTIRAEDDENWVLIRAGWTHEITALEDRTKFDCLYAHRGPAGEIVEHYEGRDDAYV